MHRLEAVAHVGEGAGHDDRHGVLDEARLHLAGEADGLQGAAVDVGEVEAGAALVGEQARRGVQLDGVGVDAGPVAVLLVGHLDVVVGVGVDVAVGAHGALQDLVVLKEIALVDAGVELVVEPAVTGSLVVCHRSNLSV